jgi:hypothetical protein
MKRALFLILVSALFSLVFFCSISYPGGEVTAGRNARVIYLEGTVRINDIQAKIGMAVKQGDRIGTGEDSYVEIGFDSSLNNNLKIDQNSSVIIKKIAPEQIDIDLSTGKIFSLLEKLDEDNTFRIITPVAVVGVRGTGWSSEAGKNESRFSVFENEVFVQGIDSFGNLMGKVIVKKGWKIGVKKFEIPARLSKVSAGERRQWRRWKRVLNKHIKSFLGKDLKGYEREGKKLKRIIEQTESNLEKGDAEKIERGIDRSTNTGGTLER